ncbi:hypothetical protein [Lactococcus garvieae]|uniref:hypothetical protein n=1 Tax=Lactococcus garvieae TaxID=1363 RepID=UPI003852A899
MQAYLEHLYNKLNNLPAGIQGIAWFISIKLSIHLLKGIENVPTYSLTVVLQFMLALIILLVGLIFIDVLSISRKKFK